MSKSAVVVENLRKSFGRIEAVKGIDLNVEKGEIVSVIGPNGAGKSTLIGMITGLLEPTSGSVKVRGANPTRHRNEIARTMGVLFQDTQLFNRALVKDYLDFYRDVYSLKQNDVDTFVDKFGLSEKRNEAVSSLSGGWRQRLAIALSIIHDPQVIILDEPTVGLDPIVRRSLWDIIRNLRSEGKTLIVTTHYMDEALSIANRVVMLNKGSVIFNGNAQEIRQYGESLPGGYDEAFEKYVVKHEESVL